MDMNPQEPQMLTTAEVATLVRVRSRSVPQWAKANGIQVHKVGRGLRYWRDDVMKALGRGTEVAS